MSSNRPTLVWFRRDLRLADHPALTAAANRGGPVIPVYILDPLTEAQGAAPKMRLEMSIAALARDLASKGSKLILRRGDPAEVLTELVNETGADAVYWSRLYWPAVNDRDAAVKSSLKDRGVDAQSFAGHLLFEPWTVQTKTGDFYKVYTPMWKSVQGRDVDPCLPVPPITAPAAWPHSAQLHDWHISADMRRGRAIVARHQSVGEAAASDRLAEFIDDKIATYHTARDMVAEDGCSGLSENLTYGEISPRALWHAGHRALQEGKAGAETFIKEVVWREFAYHLQYHTPHILRKSWRPEWTDFPWNTDDTHPDVVAWKQGRTGEPFVDAAMRELYVTGKMHNRARMIVASYLTKHLLSHWKIGMDWFADCLTDWDPASNAMGWQWAAGSGPDAAPYFRIFNPATQLEKFDPQRTYRRKWIAERYSEPTPTALEYFDAIPVSWSYHLQNGYPEPIIDLGTGRQRALDAYKTARS